VASDRAAVATTRSGKQPLSINECMALRYLHADGYATDELAFLLERKDTTIIEHVSGECGHETLAEPLPVGTISGEELRERRYAQNLTQEELAEMLGVTSSAVSAWENVEQQPRRDRAHEIERALEGGHDGE
jgi:DNA-binding transcriptional regulator YiaG